MKDVELDTTAELARMSLSDQERERLRQEVETVLTYFDSMAVVEAELGEAAAHAADDNSIVAGKLARPVTALREDRIRDDVNADVLLESAGDVEDRFIAIPNVL